MPTATALPPVVDAETWRRELDELRLREKAATRELDAIAAQRRRLPMVKLPEYTLQSAEGPVRLVDVFEDKSQLTDAVFLKALKLGHVGIFPGQPERYFVLDFTLGQHFTDEVLVASADEDGVVDDEILWES